jgi:hypothetical protein
MSRPVGRILAIKTGRLFGGIRRKSLIAKGQFLTPRCFVRFCPVFKINHGHTEDTEEPLTEERKGNEALNCSNPRMTPIHANPMSKSMVQRCCIQ